MNANNDKTTEKIHTLLIGTSKTQEGDRYFCKGPNIKKFWGTLANVNKDFNGKEQTSKLTSKGVLITDISSAKGSEEKSDNDIKAFSLKIGFKNLEYIIISHPEIVRIAFIGKLAAKLFFIRFIDRIILKKEGLTFKDCLSNYWKQDWTVYFGNKEITCFVLTNTNRQWNCDIWKEFWQEVFNPTCTKNFDCKKTNFLSI